MGFSTPTQIGFKYGFRYLTGTSLFNPTMVASASQVAWWREEATPDGSGLANPWIDKYVGFNASNGTASARPFISGSDSRFKGFLSLDFDGTNDGLTAGTVTDWRMLHNGTGALLWSVFRSESTGSQQHILTTMALSAGNTGFSIRFDGGNENLLISICDSTGVPYFQATTAAGTVTRNTQHRLVWWWKDGLAPANEFELWLDEQILLSGNVTKTPATGSSQTALFHGRNGTATQFFDGQIAECGIITDISLVSSFVSYLRARYT